MITYKSICDKLGLDFLNPPKKENKKEKGLFLKCDGPEENPFLYYPVKKCDFFMK